MTAPTPELLITEIDIEHFRSVFAETVRLDPITLLVGANSAGKTNIVDALRFVRDVYSRGLEEAIRRRGGFDTVRQKPTSGRPADIAIRIRFRVSSSWNSHLLAEPDLIPASASRTGSYRLVLSGTREEPAIKEEALSTPRLKFDAEGGVIGIDEIVVTRSRDGRATINGEELQFAVPIRESVLRFLPSDSPYGGEAIRWLLDEMTFAAIYPNSMREPKAQATSAFLDEDGANWASVVKWLESSERGKQILNRTAGVVANKVRRKTGDRVQIFDPIQVSDGTLRIFGILLALYGGPTAPALIAVEEPEQTVHPGALGVLADSFKEAATRTQLLITTHSPHLLDYFPVSSIRVVAQDEKGTRVAPVSGAQVEVVKQKLMTVSELMALDGLQQELPL